MTIFSYWSTESGSPITAIQLNSAFSPLTPRPGSAGLPLPGMDLRIVDDEGKPVKQGDMGNIVLAQPLPPSALGTVWGNEERFQESVDFDGAKRVIEADVCYARPEPTLIDSEQKVNSLTREMLVLSTTKAT